MAEQISRKTIMILTILAVIISVISITLSLISMNMAATTPEVQSQVSQEQPGGTVAVGVPAQPSESGSQVSVIVEES